MLKLINMKAGYTLIELVIVIVLIGFFAAMVLPRFVSLNHETRLAAAKGALGSIRSAVAIRYIINATIEGFDAVPDNITPEMFQNREVPIEPLTNTNEVTIVASLEDIVVGGVGWAYDNVNGKVWINNPNYINF